MNFFIHFVKNLKKTGAVAPSSKFLAQQLVQRLRIRLINETCASLNILELGPGTGSLTKEIAGVLRPQDRLDIVEIQPSFYRIIKQKYACENVHVYLQDILKFSPAVQYDYIISSLPYENMPAAVIRQIWEKKLSLCAPDSFISYYKYVNFRDFKCAFEEKVVEKYGCSKKIVFRNLPPAKLYTLQIDHSQILEGEFAVPA